MRKAFTLVEVLVVLVTLPFVLLVISGVYATFIRDIPRATRVLQVNTTVLDLLRQIRRDVEGAVALPQQLGEQRASARTLLIEQPGRVIRYQMEEGRVTRTPFVVTPSGVSSNALTGTLPTGSPTESRLWRVPDAMITWQLWEQDGRAYAVEIHSHIPQRSSGRVREKLANTQVFFLQELVQEDESR
jgi:type II secretory pathway pseudopilin PulG